MKNNHKNHKIVYSGIFILIVILSASCHIEDAYKKEIYSNPEIIAADEDSYSFEERIESFADRKLSITFGGFSGKETIKAIEGENGQSLNLTLKCNLIHGEFKICLVDPDKNVITILENSSYEQYSVKMYKGEYRIAIVGINADGNIEITEENK